ncbi:MAG: low-specificity L-threonine aldolase, partial [Anaerolineae bacterium]|nr:low-specificity L-threonine aldolase [Anaerolineae bacterium]
MRIIDLRSDTFTKPTPKMRQAMAEAEVGDDVWGEDPTVQCLEEKAAARMGKEAALFVASGTQGNLVSLLTHCGRGDEAIMGDQSHTFRYEQGGCAALGGIVPHIVKNQADGTIALADIEAAIRPDDDHAPRTRLICLENTHNRMGGVALTPEYTAQVAELAKRRGLKLHIDGARIFNAAVALGVDVKELVRGADSVTFCLSKGLAAPVGSVICGSREFIGQARRNRKILGGGMRQVGVLAAAGLIALDEMVDRLADDHANAEALAQGLAALPGIQVEPVAPRTDIVFFKVLRPDMDAVSLCERLDDFGVKMADMDPRRV